MPPEKQIITADPDINDHKITEEDEFLVLACDGSYCWCFLFCSLSSKLRVLHLPYTGIWDCLSSQAVVDFVRYQASEGKDVSEIAGLILDHCLAPTSDHLGNDNMSIIIVAILHGRTKDKWGAWIADRMKSGSGYETPCTIRPLYTKSQMETFRKRKEAAEKREAERKKESENEDTSSSGKS